MPNYILSRTSPPAHIYERKINLGYGIKVDTSDAPTNQAQKGKEMQDAKEVLDVADKPVTFPVTLPDGTVDDGEINAFASASAFDAELNAERIRADLEAKAREEAKEAARS